MTQPNHSSPLPPRVERQLAEWDLVEPSAEDFEAMAKAIERRIEDVSPGRGDDGDWLFQAPLPLVNGERVLRGEDETEAGLNSRGLNSKAAPGSKAAKAAPGAVLEPVAVNPKAALGPSAAPGREREPDSDHLSLKAIAEAAVRGSRADEREPFPTRSPAQSGIQLKAIANTVTAPGESMRPRDAAAFHPKLGPVPRVSGEQQHTPTGATAGATAVLQPKQPRKLWPGVYGLAGALALAAAVTLWVSGRGPESDAPGRTVAVSGAAEPGAEPAAAAVDGPTVQGPKRASAIEPQVAEPAQGPVDPETLPTEPPKRLASSGAARTRAPAPVADAPAARAPEAAPAEPPLIPAAELGSQPKHPSLGAAQAAVGSTLGSARLCLAGQLSPSQAMVIFGSNGRVSSIAVSGPAEGTPAEACIQRAMASARVQPFTDETFSVRTTVRP